MPSARSCAGTVARVNLDGLDVEIVEGDIRDADAVAAAYKGARYVFHVAADYRLWASDPDEITRTNVDGTRVVMTSAQSSWCRACRLYVERRNAEIARARAPGG